jgi:hypothetical protein
MRHWGRRRWAPREWVVRRTGGSVDGRRPRYLPLMRRLHESSRLPLPVLIAAHAVSLLGNTVALVAIPWFVLSTTGSAARTGIIAFFTTLPVAAGSLFAGPLTDLLGARRMSVFSDTLSALDRRRFIRRLRRRRDGRRDGRAPRPEGAAVPRRGRRRPALHLARLGHLRLHLPDHDRKPDHGRAGSGHPPMRQSARSLPFSRGARSRTRFCSPPTCPCVVTALREICTEGHVAGDWRRADGRGRCRGP